VLLSTMLTPAGGVNEAPGPRSFSRTMNQSRWSSTARPATPPPRACRSISTGRSDAGADVEPALFDRDVNNWLGNHNTSPTRESPVPFMSFASTARRAAQRRLGELPGGPDALPRSKSIPRSRPFSKRGRRPGGVPLSCVSNHRPPESQEQDRRGGLGKHVVDGARCRFGELAGAGATKAKRPIDG